jgi:ectoine hydroxylase-related dioxygenase (phytanoyl-CoA dioxygenase family)
MDITQKFTLGPELTPEQVAFFEHFGFIHFTNVATDEEVDAIVAEMDKMEQQFLEEERQTVLGVPIQWGEDEDGTRYVNRFAYASEYSDVIKKFVEDERFAGVGKLLSEDARLAQVEKDGIVINNFINTPTSAYTKLGWHTDSPRDIFYNLRKPGVMLNVGLYLDDCPLEKGGVRILPGTHTQSVFMMLFRKFPMFFTHTPDPNEVPLVVKRGDLTIHDGRAWHRTAQATLTGKASQRRTMYMAYIDEPYQPRDENSSMPLFKRLQKFVG